MCNNEGNCGYCFKSIPKKLRIIECNNCKIFFHIRCSDINKKEYLRLKDNGDDWICDSCRPPIKNQEKKIKCSDCKKTIGKNRTLIQYQVFTDPGYIPFGFEWIVNIMTKKTLPKTIENLKVWIENEK